MVLARKFPQDPVPAISAAGPQRWPPSQRAPALPSIPHTTRPHRRALTVPMPPRRLPKDRKARSIRSNALVGVGLSAPAVPRPKGVLAVEGDDGLQGHGLSAGYIVDEEVPHIPPVHFVGRVPGYRPVGKAQVRKRHNLAIHRTARTPLPALHS